MHVVDSVDLGNFIMRNVCPVVYLKWISVSIACHGECVFIVVNTCIASCNDA